MQIIQTDTTGRLCWSILKLRHGTEHNVYHSHYVTCPVMESCSSSSSEEKVTYKDEQLSCFQSLKTTFVSCYEIKI